MKLLGTISIEAPSANDLKEAEKIMSKAIDEARLHINNGSKVKRAWTNGDDPRAMMAVMGQLKWWSLGRPEIVVKHQKKSSIWSQAREEIRKLNLGKEIRSMYEDEPEI